MFAIWRSAIERLTHPCSTSDYQLEMCVRASRPTRAFSNAHTCTNRRGEFFSKPPIGLSPIHKPQKGCRLISILGIATWKICLFSSLNFDTSKMAAISIDKTANVIKTATIFVPRIQEQTKFIYTRNLFIHGLFTRSKYDKFSVASRR